MNNNEPIYVVTHFDLNSLTGTPSRARTTIEAIKKIRNIKILSTAAYGDKTADYTHQINKWEKKSLFKQAIQFLKKHFRNQLLWLWLILTLFKEKPQKIYAFTTIPASAAAIYKFFSKAKLIAEIHGMERVKEKRSLIWLLLDHIFYSCADEFVVMSDRMKENVHALYKIPYSRIHRIYAPINIKQINFIPLKKSDKLIVGYGGNDAKYQNFDKIMESVKILSGEKNLEFRIFGITADKYKDYLAGNIKFFGLLSGQKFFDELSNCHVFLSMYEKKFGEGSFPHKMASYLAVGRPVITTDSSDCKKVVEDARCGLVIPYPDAKLLAEAIKEMQQKPFSELEQMGKNARKFAEENLSEKQLIKQLELIFNKVNI